MNQSKKQISNPIILLVIILSIFSISMMQSCRGFKQNILFVSDSSINVEAFHEVYEHATQNYVISNMDYIAISVFTDSAEVLIDPNDNFEGGDNTNNAGGLYSNNSQLRLLNQNNLGGGGGSINSRISLPISSNMQKPRHYLVNGDGKVNLPMVGKITLSGYTLAQADSVLSEAFAYYYEKPFVVTQYLNKRVVLMGALGDRVMPIIEENLTLIELLAIAGGFQERAKANNIRIIRGKGSKTSVQIVDLTTISGMQIANMDLMPNDIVYVEPRRKLDKAAYGELNTAISPIATITSAISSLATIYLLVKQLF